MHAAADLTAVHEVLKRIGPVEVILDLRTVDSADRYRWWHTLYFHLRNGGKYVLAQTDGPLDQSLRAWGGALAVGDASISKLEPRLGTEHLASTEEVLITRVQLTLVKKHHHLLKLRDSEADELLAVREPMIDVDRLGYLPGGEFEAADTVIHHHADTPITWPRSTVRYPPLYLRHYHGPLGYGTHTLAHGQRSILPESFRWHLIDNPTNPATFNASESFARLRAWPRTAWAGDYYQLDPQHGGFGHVMTEMVGRLWGWELAKAELPGLKAVFSVQNRRGVATSPKRRLLQAYGIADDDIVWTDRPVNMSSLVGATCMWHNDNPYYVHPDIRAVWERLGAGLIDPTVTTYDKVFVSRGPGYRRRSCRNADQVERTFADQGFQIIYPETMDFAAQAAVFADARVLAGFGGSGLFNIAFARRLEVGIFLNQDAYYHRNEHMFTSLLGGNIHYFWSPADVKPAGLEPDHLASESSWAFDLARHSRDLASVLNSV